MVYNYPVTGNIAVMALKIEKGLAKPDGMYGMVNGSSTGVIFNTPLSDAQKATLDTIMADANVGVIPTTNNTVFALDDLLDNRTLFKSASGLTCDIYPGTAPDSKTYIVFNKTLTTSENNTLKNAFAAFLKQIQ